MDQPVGNTLGQVKLVFESSIAIPENKVTSKSEYAIWGLRRTGTCGGALKTTGWSCITSPPMPFRRRWSSSPSARATWGSRRTGTCGGIYSGVNSTPSPSRRGCGARSRRRPDTPSAGVEEGPMHPLHDDIEQPRVGPKVVLLAERRREASSVHRQGPDGEAGRLGVRGVAPPIARRGSRCTPTRCAGCRTRD